MKTSRRMFEMIALDVRNLAEEHVEICVRYIVLEKEILHGREMPHILKAADSLVQMMLQHFTHEEQLLPNLSLSSRLRNNLREANMDITARLNGIEVELEQGKTAAIFQLLSIGKYWIKEHMHLESVESVCWLPDGCSNRVQKALSPELSMPQSV